MISNDYQLGRDKFNRPKASTLLVLLSFIWAGFDIIYFSIALGLFLKSFGVKYFPHSVVLSATIQFFIGWVLNHADKQVSRRAILSATCFFNVGLSLLLYLLVTVYSQEWAIFLTYCLVSMFTGLFSSVRYDLASFYFDIQQMKTIGPSLTRGYEAGILTLGVALQPLLNVFSAESLFVMPFILSIAFLVLFFLSVQLLKINFPTLHHTNTHSFSTDRIKHQNFNISYFYKDEYTRYIFLSLVCLSVIFNFWSYLFFKVLEDTFTLKESISSFIAIFNAILSLIVVLTMTISVRLIKRFGISIGYRSIAIVAFLGSIIAFVSDVFMKVCAKFSLEIIPNIVWRVCTSSVIILGMFLISYAMYNIYDPIKILLTQPYPDQVKTQINRFVSLVMSPACAVLSAGLVYLSVNVFDFSTLGLLFTIYIISVALKLLASYVTQEYVKKVSSRLIRKVINPTDLNAIDRETHLLIVKDLNSSDHTKVAQAINLLSAFESRLLPQYTAKLFEISRRDAIICALRIVGDLRLEKYEDKVREVVLDEEKQPDIRAQALKVYAKLSSPESALIAAMNESDHVQIKKEAMIIKVAANNDETTLLVRQYFSSSNQSERLFALDIAAQSLPGLFSREIEAMTQADNIEIRAQAIRTACSLKMTSAIPLALDLIQNPQHRQDMMACLQFFGEEVTSFIGDIISDKHALFAQFKVIVRTLSKMGNAKVNHFLLIKSFELSSRRKDYILKCLLTHRFVLEKPDSVILEKEMTKTLKLLHQLIQINQVFAQHQGTEQIQDGLNETIGLSIKRLLIYTAFKHPDIDKSFLLRNFYSNDVSLRALSLEYLEYVLTHQEKKQLMPIFANKENTVQIMQHLDRHYPQKTYSMADCLQAILEARLTVGLWAFISTMLYVGSQKVEDLSNQVSKHVDDSVPVVAETAYLTLYNLDKKAFIERKNDVKAHRFFQVRRLLTLLSIEH